MLTTSWTGKVANEYEYPSTRKGDYFMMQEGRGAVFTAPMMHPDDLEFSAGPA
jgi:hypothetical protein